MTQAQQRRGRQGGRSRGRAVAGVLSAALILAAVAAGCSSGAGDSASEAGAEGGADYAAVEPGGGDDRTGATDGGGGSGEAAMAGPAAGDATGLPETRTSAVVTENRDVVYTAELQVRVTDVQAAVTRAEVIALAAQGLVVGEETYGSPDEPTAGSSRLVLRVPPVAFRETLGDLRDLGETLSSTQTADDVSAQVTDLDSRLGSQRASVERIRALLSQAQQIADIVAIESELAAREAELESLQAQRERLGDLTALSTITVSLVGPTAEQVEQEPDVGFLAGIRSGWEAFGRTTAVVLTVAGAVLPFLIAAAVVGAPVAYVLRLRRRRIATQPAAQQA